MPVSVLADPQFAFEVAEGATIPIVFTLRNRRTGLPLNVSGATTIRLEWEVEGVTKAPVIASSSHPDADWVNGKVAVVVSPDDLTSVPQTTKATLTAIYSTAEVPMASGIIEIVDRPGFPLP